VTFIKKFRFVLLLIGIIPLETRAQSEGFSIGLAVGPDFGSVRGDYLVNMDNTSRLGFGTEAFLQFHFNKNFSIRSGLAYEEKGAHSTLQIITNYGYPLGDSITNLHLNYLVIPVLFRAELRTKNVLFANIGPYIGFLLKASQEIVSGNEPNLKTDVKQAYSSTDFGMSLGIGIIFPVWKRTGLSGELRDNLGMKNIAAHDQHAIKNNSFQCLIGLIYDLR